MLEFLWIIAVIILALWLLGLLFRFIVGPLLWIILVIGVIVLIVWLFVGRAAA